VKRLRVAVIGAGVMGKYHANIYAALPHVDLVAVIDPLEARRREVRETFACAAYPQLDTLLAANDIDAASIAAPTSLHFHLAQQLLEAGIHVLVEKPVATDVCQAQRLVALSRQRGLVLQVGHITRFYQAVQLLNEQVSNPYLIEARRLTPHARIKDVGVILDLMIHDIDTVLRIVPGNISEANVSGRVLNGSPFEDVAAAQITFENGCIARFLASRVAPNAERSLVVAEPTQTLKFDFTKDPHTEILIYRSRDIDEAGYVQMERRLVHEDNPLRKELEHFLARIRNRADPIGTLYDDLRSLKLATWLTDSIATKKMAAPVFV